MNARKSLVIYLPSLASGGAERAHINMAPAFIDAGYDVTFLLQRAEGAYLSSLPFGVRVVSLNCNRTFACLWPLIRFLRKERPSLLIANLGHNNIMAIWARGLARAPTKIIATFHNTLSRECSERKNWQYKILPLLCRWFLRQADGIVTVSKGVADDLTKTTGIAADKISAIYNPVVTDDFDQRMNAPVAHEWFDQDIPIILGVGRLVAAKDFKTLISAFGLVTRQRKARLILIGEGPERDNLLHHAQQENIAEYVSMPGFQSNPLPFMHKASVLVLSSRYEGFGNVLAEALACGTPVVSTDCPYGPAEILANGRYGALVPVGDVQAMANAIIATLNNPIAADVLKWRGEEFSVEQAVMLYTKLFDRLALSSARRR